MTDLFDQDTIVSADYASDTPTGDIQVVSVESGDELGALMEALGAGRNEKKEPDPVSVSPNRIIQALEQHRRLFVDFKTEEIESAEHCLVAAAIVLYKKSFQDIMNSNQPAQVEGVINLAIEFAKVLPDAYSVTPKRPGRTGRQGGGYI